MRHRKNTLQTTACLIAGLLISAIPLHAPAQDIDLFLGNKTKNTTVPNLMIFIDNSSNANSSINNACTNVAPYAANNGINKKIALERCALVKVLQSIDFSATPMNIGLVSFTPSGSAENGGYIHLRALDMSVAANKTTLLNSINGFPTYNNAPYSLGVWETYLYYAGKAPYSGTGGSTDSVRDVAAIAGGLYDSPAKDSCQKNYILYIGNGGPDNSDNANKGLDGTPMPQYLVNTIAVPKWTTPLPATPNNYTFDNWADETTHTLFYGPETSPNISFTTPNGISGNISTFVLKVHDITAPNDNNKTELAKRALLDSMAFHGGTEKAFDVYDEVSLRNALNNALAQMLSVNSVFASVTLPVSVNVRGTYLDQVYMGVFRPDDSALPRWMGNLKQYRVAVNATTNTVYMVDSVGNTISNNSTGFINDNVVSYWTKPSTFWTFAPSGLGKDSDSPDGAIVEKGGEAQWLRDTYANSQTARKVYTCTGGCANGSLLSATLFDNSNANVTQANTGTISAQDRTDLINWVRGTDVYNENQNFDALLNPIITDARASIHGDVLHSRPAVINYNRDGTDNDVFIYYGANDGLFHAVKGGRATDGGTEQWSFVPPEFFGNLKRIRDNNVNIVSPNPNKPFFFDGPVGVYQNDVDGDGKLTSADIVQITAGARRGGQLLYSFDVTTPNTPKLKWKATKTTNGYAELGQTWSLPISAKIRATNNPVFVMGAGYDPAGEDLLPRGVDTSGRGILVIDATTGNVLWQAGPSPSGAATNVAVAGMLYSFPSDPLVIDRDYDGYADRIYAVDAGANIWRVDMDDTSPANWTVTKIAELGGAGNNDRKFLYPPDVVFGDASHPYDSILVGSGDREHPFDTTIANRYYMVKDPNMGKSINAGFTFIKEGDLYDATDDLVQSTNLTLSSAAQSSLDSSKGWYITLLSGEKVVGSSVVIGGAVYFATYQPTTPAPGVCNDLGTARAYMLNYLDGGAVTGTTAGARTLLIPGGGFPPSPVAIVTLQGDKLGQGVCFGPNCFNGKPPKLGARYKMYWHNDRDK